MVSQKSVVEFKVEHCDENQVIAGLLKREFKEYIIEPIVDVGAGLGDIMCSAFPFKRVTHVDVLDFSESGYILPSLQRREIIDFFDLPLFKKGVGTLFFSHVLQYIDDDIEKLNQKVEELSPATVIIVVNVNDHVLGDILDWASLNLSNYNPEIDIPTFPRGYSKRKEIKFQGKVFSDDFKSLTQQVCYLLDTVPSLAESGNLEKHLKKQLNTPDFIINQKITAYVRK